MVKCERCGHILTNPESIKNGYGKTCYRIIQLQKPEAKEDFNINEIKIFITSEIQKALKEFNFSRLVIRNDDSVGIVPVRITKMPKFDINETNRQLVIKELKEQIQKGIGNILRKVGSFDNEIKFLEI